MQHNKSTRAEKEHAFQKNLGNLKKIREKKLDQKEFLEEELKILDMAIKDMGNYKTLMLQLENKPEDLDEVDKETETLPNGEELLRAEAKKKIDHLNYKLDRMRSDLKDNAEMLHMYAKRLNYKRISEYCQAVVTDLKDIEKHEERIRENMDKFHDTMGEDIASEKRLED